MLSLGAALGPEAVPAAQASEPGPVLATLFDLSRCIGCGACVTACKEHNAAKHPRLQGPIPVPFPAKTPIEDYSKRKDVEDRLTPYNWLTVQHIEAETPGGKTTVHMPRRCMHCEKPPCQALCPFGAISNNRAGSVAIDPDLCFGGAKCRDICPWGIPQRQSGVGLYLELMPRFAGNGVMYKCDRCPDRLAKGQLPACIEACPQDVQSMGPKEDVIRQAKALAASTGGEIYGMTENGGTLTLYVSPVPVPQLHAHLVPGPGNPGLPRTQSPLASPEVLAGSVLLAPVAGSIRRAATAVRLTRRALTDTGRRTAEADTLAASRSRPETSAYETPSHGAHALEPASPPPGDASQSRIPGTGRAASRLLGASMALAALTGLLQMPLAKRYWLASAPGLHWTASPSVSALVHLAAASLLLFAVFRQAGALHRVMALLVAVSGLARPLAASLALPLPSPLAAWLAFGHFGLLALWLALGLGLSPARSRKAGRT